MNKANSRVEQEFQRALRRLQEQGYERAKPEDLTEIPDEIIQLAPDFIAKRGEEFVIVVAKSESRGADLRLEHLAEAVNRHPKIRLDLVWSRPRQSTPTIRRVVAAYAEHANRVAKTDAVAGLLLGWQAATVALDQLLEDALSSPPLEIAEYGEPPGIGEHGEPLEADEHGEHQTDPHFGGRLSASIRRGRNYRVADSPKAKVAQAESLGLLSERVYFQLSRLADLRNQALHGSPSSTKVQPQEVYRLLEIASRLADPDYVSPDGLIDWFRENYEVAKPEEFDRRRYEGRGFHSVEGTLKTKFPRVNPNDLADAIEMLESESTQWVWKRPWENARQQRNQ